MREEHGGVEADPFDGYMSMPLPDYDSIGVEQKKIQWLEEQVNGIFTDIDSLQTRVRMLHCELQAYVPSSDMETVRKKLDMVESILTSYLITKVGFTYDEVEDGVQQLVYKGTGE